MMNKLYFVSYWLNANSRRILFAMMVVALMIGFTSVLVGPGLVHISGQAGGGSG